MQQNLIVALLSGLGGMFGWGFADFFAKKTIDRIGGLVSLVWAHLFGTMILILLIVFEYVIFGKFVSFPNSFITYMGLAFFGALQAIIYLLVYIGFGKGQLAILNPVFASYSGLAALISIFLFGEKINNHLFLALIVIFSGIILLNTDTSLLHKRKISLVVTPGFKEVGLAAILAGFWTVLWDK